MTIFHISKLSHVWTSLTFVYLTHVNSSSRTIWHLWNFHTYKFNLMYVWRFHTFEYLTQLKMSDIKISHIRKCHTHLDFTHIDISHICKSHAYENLTLLTIARVSLTSVSIKGCTLRVPNETITSFLLRVIIKAIFIQHVILTMTWMCEYIETQRRHECNQNNHNT